MPAAAAPTAAPADEVRDAFALALRQAGAATTASEQEGKVGEAQRLAGDYAATWNDSFLVRRVAWFESATPAQRRASALADSLWRAGRVAFGSDGVPAAMRLWRESLRHAGAARDSAGRAVAMGAIGAGFYASGELDSASAYLRQARRLSAATGDFRTLGNAVGNLGSVRKDQGDLAEAAELYEEAAAIRPKSGDTRGNASDQNNRGLVARSMGDLTTAREAFERALALNRSGGYPRYAAINLTNLGDLASLQGDYAAAEAAYAEALALNRIAGDVAETAYVLHDLGLLATRRGDYEAALAALSEALVIHEDAGATAEATSVRGDLAAVQAAMGLLRDAARTLERADSIAGSEGLAPVVRANLALARADLEVQLGRLDAAAADYARAERWFVEAAEPSGAADAQRGRGLLLHLRGDRPGALRVLELAAQRQAGEGDRRAAAVTRLLVGEVQRDSGDTAASRRTLTAAHRAFVSAGDVTGEVAAMIALGDLAVQHGAPLAAEAWYQRGLTRLGNRQMPDLRWRLQSGLGSALKGRGALDAAAERFREATTTLEEVAAGLPAGERRAGFLADKWQVYASLALVEQSRGRAGSAFTVSERMRGRQMLATMSRGRVSTRGPEAAREQDLRRRISELTREIESDASGIGAAREPGLGRRDPAVAFEALDAAQKAYADLLAEVREGDPEYAALVSTPPVDWRDVSRNLGPDAVFLQYLLTDSASSVFVITADTVAAIDLNVRRRELAGLVDFARRGLDRPDPSADPIWRAPLRRLHHLLIEPVERAGYFEGRRTLVIAPHAELHFLPFGALVAPGAPERFLVERFQLVHAPSASIWMRRQDDGAPARRGRVLALAPHPARLPGSGNEVAGIGRIYGRRAKTLAGPTATEQAFRAEARRHDVLHIASFGVLNKHNPLFSYVELAPGRDGDGRLEVHEVFDLDLSGQLVVLSACQTALGSGAQADVPAGDDWVGLVQSFLQAGAGSVVASLWRVEDRATADLMQQLYRRLAVGQPRAEALAGAQRALLRRPETAHPFYWAGFVLSGSGLH